jgi:hypothetical protein
MMFTCQRCGIDAPTQEVALHQNIGLLAFRLSQSTEGHLCRRCIAATVRQYTLVNLTLGWWGVISFFLTPVFLFSNLAQYLAARRLPPVPDDAGRPRLTDELRARLAPLNGEIAACLRRGDAPELVAVALAEQAQITPAQALLYIKFEVDAGPA